LFFPLGAVFFFFLLFAGRQVPLLWKWSSRGLLPGRRRSLLRKRGPPFFLAARSSLTFSTPFNKVQRRFPHGWASALQFSFFFQSSHTFLRNTFSLFIFSGHAIGGSPFFLCVGTLVGLAVLSLPVVLHGFSVLFCPVDSFQDSFWAGSLSPKVPFPLVPLNSGNGSSL